MTQNNRIEELKRLLKKCPQCLTPRKINKFTPLSRNQIYHLIHTGELPSFIFQGTYIINKDDLLEYLITHIDDTTNGFKTHAAQSPNSHEKGNAE